jgi:hypothetical protein
MRPDAVPQRGLRPHHARTMHFSQTAGHVSSKTPRAAPPVRSASGVKRPGRARVTAAERRNGRGPSNDIESPSTFISYMFITIRSGAYF